MRVEKSEHYFIGDTNKYKQIVHNFDQIHTMSVYIVHVCSYSYQPDTAD